MNEIDKNIWIIRIIIIIIFIIIYIYVICTNPHKITNKTMFFDILFFLIPFVVLMFAPDSAILTDETGDSASLEGAISNILPLIAAIAVLGTFFLSQGGAKHRFDYLVEILLFAAIFGIFAILPLFNNCEKKPKMLYQFNMRLLCSACCLSLVGRSLYSLVEIDEQDIIKDQKVNKEHLLNKK